MSWQCPLYEHSVPLRYIQCSGQPKSALCSLQFFALPYYYIIPKFFKNRRKGKYNFPFHQIKPYLFINFLIIIWRIYFFIVILRHYGSIVVMNMKRLKAMFMSEKEFDLYVEALDKGLLEAERTMLHEKAARGETCVYQDDNGRIYHVAAKDVIAANPRFQ